MKSYTWREYAMGAIAVVLVAIGFDMVIDAYDLYQEEIAAPNQVAEVLANKSEWITYTNTDYGYQISYPQEVEFVKASDRATLNVDPVTKNQVVFIGDTEGTMVYNMSAGATTVNYVATSSKKLKEKFLANTVPKLVGSRTGEQLSLTPEDFTVNEITHNNRPAIEVMSPVAYMMETSNNEGIVFSVIVGDYTGSTSTPKERLTWEIMQTFTVLE